ncbi:gustatory receptor 68a-like [Zophobas morio]|uniref:gustatory receptor 68a-like n=1 Tax=Zophobas morio TaxID=2755281 RepID=UPI0030833EAE
MKRVVSILMDIIAYLFNCYTIVSTTFYHQKQWSALIKTIKCDQHIHKIPLHLDFILLNIVFWIILFCSNYAFHQIVVFKTIKDIAVIDVEIYTQFVFGYLIFVVTGMLRSKYRYLRNFLENYHQTFHTKSISGDEFLLFMKKMEHVAYTLKESVDHFNDIFGIPLLLMISYATLHFVNYIDDLFFFRFNPDKYYHFFISNVLVVSMIFLGNCMLIVMCDSVLKEALKVVGFAYKLRKNFPSALSRQRVEVNEFIDFVIRNFPKFSAAGFFDIDRSTIFKLLGTVTTLLIVMVQFDTNNTGI